MQSRQILAAVIGLALGFEGLCAANEAGTAIEAATYSALFDRARVLIPGCTIVEQSPLDTGVWEVVAADRETADEKDSVSLVADGNTVDLVWKGEFKRTLHLLHIEFAVRVEDGTPAEIQFSRFADGRFDKVGSKRSASPEDRKPFAFKFKGADFGGFRIRLYHEDLAGKHIVVQDLRLYAEIYEGYFRRDIVLPAGEVWEASAEVGEMTALYVNGQHVEDPSVVMPVPISPNISYRSRRLSLKPYLRPGRKNVLAMYVMRNDYVTGAYLRGSAIMASGERVVLDSGTNWVWRRTEPGGWPAGTYEPAAWMPVAESGPDDSFYRMMVRKEPQAQALRCTRFAFTYRPPGEMPCYDGTIKLVNPRDRKLFFSDTEPFQLGVRIPPGFERDDPAVAWEISRFAGGDVFEEAASGVVTGLKPEGASLCGTIQAGALPRGVYVLTARLQTKGVLVEEREPEPFVVCGKIEMPVAPGDTLEQGLNLELEQIVDFTDPDDPHPWVETDTKAPLPRGAEWGPDYYHTLKDPIIVEREGLRYRTTRPAYEAQFSYQVKFAHPGDWYLMVIEYPDDAERWIGVSCNAASRNDREAWRYDCCSKCGPIVWTGGKYPNSGKMLEMKWVYRPDPGPHAINVMSLMKRTEAAAARLRIYHVAGRLSELDVGSIPPAEQRRFGMLTERTTPWCNGVYNLFSSFASDEVSSPWHDAGAGRISTNAIVEGCGKLHMLEDAASRYAEYMRFAGQNLHGMGCWQYNDGNTAPQFLTGDVRLHDNSRDMLGRVLDANGLQFFASVEFVATVRRIKSREPDPAWYFVGRDGKTRSGFIGGTGLGGFNFLHPDIEQDMLKVARQLAEEFKHQAGFLGINWTAYFGGSWLPSYRAGAGAPLDLGYGDLTIALFEKDTGIDVPGKAEDAERCAQRYEFLTSEAMKPRWLAWRSQKLAEFFVKVNRVIKKVRPDLETVASCYVNWMHIAEWQHEGTSFRDYLDAWGWNPAAFEGRPDLWLMPWLHLNARYRPAHRTMDYAMAWQGNHDPEFYRPFQALENRALMLAALWHEVERVSAHFPDQEGWPRPYQQTMMGQQREEFAMEPYTQAMIGMDPRMVMMGMTDVSPYIGVEHVQRKFARVLRRLPQGKFESVLNTGFTSNFAIRALRDGEDTHFYVANPGYWPIAGSVTVTGAARVSDLVSGKPVPLQDSAIPIHLEPFGLAAFTAAGQDVRITEWQTEPVLESELAHMRSILHRAEKTAARPGLADFLGAEDFAILTDTAARAGKALNEQRYAAAWRALTDAFFWTVLFQKAPELKYAEIVKPRELAAASVDPGLAPVIDGKLDDPIWNQPYCRPVGNFVTRNKEPSTLKTLVRVARAGNRLFLAFELWDPEPANIRGTADREDEKSIWGSGDDLVDFFVMPDKQHYYQFAVTANGATFDQRCSLTGMRDYTYAPDWQAATRIHDRGWTVEVELDTEKAFAVPIRNGEEWKINFHRMFRQKQKPYSSWVFSPGWHSMEHMGRVRFVPSLPDEKE